MTSKIKELASGLAVAILIPVIWFGPTALVAWELNHQAEFWRENYEFHKNKYDYYFDGANTRGLLDICPNEDGKPDVRFKEDCK